MKNNKKSIIVILILIWSFVIFWFFNSLNQTNEYLSQCGIELLLPLLIKSALIVGTIIISIRILSNIQKGIGILQVLLFVAMGVFYLCSIMSFLSLSFNILIGNSIDVEKTQKILLLIYQKSISAFIGIIIGISIGFLILPLVDSITLKKR